MLGDRGLLPGGERLWLKRSRGGRATSRDLGGEGVRFLSTATVRPNSSTNVLSRDLERERLRVLLRLRDPLRFLLRERLRLLLRDRRDRL